LVRKVFFEKYRAKVRFSILDLLKGNGNIKEDFVKKDLYRCYSPTVFFHIGDFSK